MTRRNLTAAISIAVVAALVLSETARLLAFGWIYFIARVFPKATVNWEGVAVTVVICAAALLSVDLFSRAVMRTIPLEESETRRVWRCRWSVYLLVTPAVMFVAAYASVAMARHVGWLINSP